MLASYLPLMALPIFYHIMLNSTIFYIVIFISFLTTKQKPRLSRHSQEILRTCTHTGGCLPKYSWVSYMNASIHAIFRDQLPFQKLVGSKISCLSYYAGIFSILIMVLLYHRFLGIFNGFFLPILFINVVFILLFLFYLFFSILFACF